MRSSVRLAKQHGVGVGAHISYPDLVGFGRRDMILSREEVTDITVHQIGALWGFCQAEGLTLEHVKGHGYLGVKSWSNARVINTKNLTKLTYEIVLGIREILLIGKVSEILKKYKLFQKESSNIESKVELVQTLPRVTIELFAIFLFLLTFIYLSFQNILMV